MRRSGEVSVTLPRRRWYPAYRVRITSFVIGDRVPKCRRQWLPPTERANLNSRAEPHRTEVEGLGFSPDGMMHVIVIAPYTTPLYATGTKNPKLFDGSYSIDGDDWNPSGTLRHFTRTADPLRDQLCRMQ
jgi:hypothetical protein